MLPFFLHRIVQAALILVLVSFVGFAITLAAPGNAMQTFIDPGISVEDLRAAEARLGLDQPVPVQYLRWLREVVTGNLGFSSRTGAPVADLIGARIGPTLTLMGTAFLISLALALWLGTMTAARPYSLLDYGVTGLAFAGISVPSFFSAMALIYIFSLQLGWLPTSGTRVVRRRVRGLAPPAGPGRAPGAARRRAGPDRHRRAGAARARRRGRDAAGGLRPHRPRQGRARRTRPARHALRNGLLPVITLVGVALPRLLAGSVVIEVVFAWPGMGRLLVESVFARDVPVAMSINLIAATLVLMGSLLADMAYAAVDPRVRYG